MIHFKLKEFDQIMPMGQKPDLYLSWFWLTEGELWLTFGNITIYEYAAEAKQLNSIRYNEYFLVRFLEDFTHCFEQINEPISESLFNLTANIPMFLEKIEALNEKNEIKYEEYSSLIQWVYDRCFDSAHLIGGPVLFFFRHENTIRIVWKTDYFLEDGTSLWTAKDGYFDMDFDLFIENVKDFGTRFFKEMDNTIASAIESDLKDVRLDKKRLLEEHQERKADFDSKFAKLIQTPVLTTNWQKIENLVSLKSKI